MFVPFDQLSGSSRIWIYQLDRALSASEATRVESVMKAFCNQWVAHGSPLVSSFQILYSHFLILSVDEQPSSASGCSIDGSVRVLKDLGLELEIDFLGRDKTSFLTEGEIKLYPITELKSLFQSGTLKADSLSFNNLVATKAEFERGWKVEVKDSWMSKYLPKTTLA